MPLVIITIIITFLVLIIWTYRSLGNIETSKKVIYIIAQLVVVFIATYITYEISKNNIEYPNGTAKTYIQNTLVFIFTGINGLFVMPLFSRQIEVAFQENSISSKLIKTALICLGILVILLLFECGYMTTTQQGILRIMTGDK